MTPTEWLQFTLGLGELCQSLWSYQRLYLWCSFQTVSAWYIPSALAGRGSSPFRLSIFWLAVQPLSLFLSLSVRGNLPSRRTVHSTIQWQGSWSSPPDLRSGSSGQRGWHMLLCTAPSIGGAPGSTPPVVCSTLSWRGSRSSPPGPC